MLRFRSDDDKLDEEFKNEETEQEQQGETVETSSEEHQSPALRYPVVAFGASAGGFEERARPVGAAMNVVLELRQGTTTAVEVPIRENA